MKIFYFSLLIGENFTSCDENATGEEHLQRCLETMEDYMLTKDGAGIYQEVLNQLGILSASRGKPEEAVKFFSQSEALYNDYKGIVGGAPKFVDEWLEKPCSDEEKLESRRSVIFEENYTLTLYYFAQAYQSLGEFEISAQYCHITLQRQLDSNSYDPLEWALSCATLSQYFMTEKDFTMSRHCLASADFIFEQAAGNQAEYSEEKKEKIQQGKADIQRCWVKYHLNLMEHSKDELLVEASSLGKNQTETDDSQSSRTESSDVALPELTPDSGSLSSEQVGDTDHEVPTSFRDPGKEVASKFENPEASNDIEDHEISTTNDKKEFSRGKENVGEIEGKESDTNKKEDQTTKVYQKPKNKASPRFNLEVISREEKVTDKPFKTFDEARVIFLIIKKLIENSKEFYKLEEHCPDYVTIVQDHSASFKHLAFFELDLERQCKMHKRRIDMLTEVLKELSLQHYLLLCRQLMFEIADTYSAMMDLKSAVLEAAGPNVRPTPHSIKKINTLAKESIRYYQEYLNTLKGGKPVYPDQFPENDERPGLVAMFCIGRLHSKIVTGDVQGRLLNIKKSKDCYQFVVDYCKQNHSAAKLVAAELDICNEMVLLLPKKMEKIRVESEI